MDGLYFWKLKRCISSSTILFFNVISGMSSRICKEAIYNDVIAKNSATLPDHTLHDKHRNNIIRLQDILIEWISMNEACHGTLVIN